MYTAAKIIAEWQNELKAEAQNALGEIYKNEAH
jgi:hypothetical protein